MITLAHFNPLSPREGATRTALVGRISRQFQPTPPVKGATKPSQANRVGDRFQSMLKSGI